jgi:hypothetical protein
MRFFSFINKCAKGGLVTPRSFSIFMGALALSVVLYAAFGGAWSWLFNVVIFGSMFTERYQREHWDRGYTAKWGEAVAYVWLINATMVLGVVCWFIYKWVTPAILLTTIPMMWQGYYVAVARSGRVSN